MNEAVLKMLAEIEKINNKISLPDHVLKAMELPKIPTLPDHVLKVMELSKAVQMSNDIYDKFLKPSEVVSMLHKQLYEDNTHLHLSKHDELFKTINAISKFDIVTTDYLRYQEYDLHPDTKELEPEKQTEITVVRNNIIQSIYDTYNKSDIIYSLSPREFEEYVAELLRHKGFEVDLTKQTRDGGYDILAIKSIGGLDYKHLIECKRYKKDKNIGVSIIREFMHVIAEQNANKGIIVTTSTFSKDAKMKRENTPYMLDLKDNADIMKWTEEYYLDKLKNIKGI